VTERIVVISDLHANGRALVAALARATSLGRDRLVILGDLLTYGDDIEQTLDLVEAEVASGAILIAGNHDQLYLDLAAGERAYYEGLPPWIRETVDHTMACVDIARFRALPWADEWTANGVLFSHANPFGARDWTYLNDDAQYVRAAQVLAGRGFRAGVFGHTHRAKLFGVGEATLVANSGSVGQPRAKPAIATVLRLAIEQRAVDAVVEPVDYDVTGHIASIDRMPLSEPTRQRLRGFFG
jgi:predicted phosphodiesterase